MAETEIPNGPGYDRNGQWHGPATEEVLYWKRRALKAESRPVNPTDDTISIVAGTAVLRRG